MLIIEKQFFPNLIERDNQQNTSFQYYTTYDHNRPILQATLYMWKGILVLIFFKLGQRRLLPYYDAYDAGPNLVDVGPHEGSGLKNQYQCIIILF